MPPLPVQGGRLQEGQEEPVAVLLPKGLGHQGEPGLEPQGPLEAPPAPLVVGKPPFLRGEPGEVLCTDIVYLGPPPP